MRSKKSLLIYVVEDNRIYNHFVCEYLRKFDYLNVKSFLSGKACIQAVSDGESPDIVIQDYFLDDSTGIEVMQAVKEHSKRSEFIFLTVNENLEEAVNVVRLGAYDYILKDNDVTLKKVVHNIEKIVRQIEIRQSTEFIKKLIITSVVILIAIVVIAYLHSVLNVFGLK